MSSRQVGNTACYATSVSGGNQGNYCERRQGVAVEVSAHGKIIWDLPGGRIDDDESIEEAFAREVAEELPGMKRPKLLELVHAARAPGNFTNGDGMMWLFYKAAADIEHLDEQTEHEGHEWFSPEDLPGLAKRGDVVLPSAFETALKKVLEKK